MGELEYLCWALAALVAVIIAGGGFACAAAMDEMDEMDALDVDL